MFAAMFNRAEAVRALLRAGARPERASADGQTARQLAEAMGAVEAAALLREL